eukprot:g28320.t1
MPEVIQCWSEVADKLLPDCLESADWSIFKNSAATLNEHGTTVTDFISKCVDDCVPKKLIQMFLKWKPWMNWNIHSLLKSRSEVFNSGDPDLCMKCSVTKFSSNSIYKVAGDANIVGQISNNDETEYRKEMIENLVAVV